MRVLLKASFRRRKKKNHGRTVRWRMRGEKVIHVNATIWQWIEFERDYLFSERNSSAQLRNHHPAMEINKKLFHESLRNMSFKWLNMGEHFFTTYIYEICLFVRSLAHATRNLLVHFSNGSWHCTAKHICSLCLFNKLYQNRSKFNFTCADSQQIFHFFLIHIH